MSHKMNRQPNRGVAQHQGNDQVYRLQRQVGDQQRLIDRLVLRNARNDAEAMVRQLEEEGVIFGDTPEEHAKGREEEVVMLARMTPADQKACVEVMKRRYRRREADPATPVYPGAARYARAESPDLQGDDFEPQNLQEAQLYAQALLKSGSDHAKAAQYMRQNGHRGAPRR